MFTASVAWAGDIGSPFLINAWSDADDCVVLRPRALDSSTQRVAFLNALSRLLLTLDAGNDLRFFRLL